MSSRISELEDALAALQSQLSAEPHPLLSDAHLEVKVPPDNPDKDEDGLDESEGPLLRQRGTLVVGERAVPQTRQTLHISKFKSEARRRAINRSAKLELITRLSVGSREIMICIINRQDDPITGFSESRLAFERATAPE